MKLNVKTIKLTGIPDVHKTSYKTMLKRVCHCRVIQEIGDIETVNHTVLGLLRRQGFTFDIITK
mgnify:CR=1 FL=1